MFNLLENEELKVLLHKFVGQSPHGYIENIGNGALELLKTKPIPKEEDLLISKRDKLLSTILGGMENIEINLSNEETVNPLSFNLETISSEELQESKLENPILSTWYEDYEDEFMYHKPTNIVIIKGYENTTCYWLICRMGTLKPFQIYLPKLYKLDGVHSSYDAFFTMSKNNIQYIHQYLYVGDNKFLSFYQIFWDLVNSKQKIIRRKVERNTEIVKLNVIDECLREAMKITCTYTSMDLSNYSLWLMSRQFKIQEVDDGKGNVDYRKIKGKWYDKVTGSFGNVGSKHSLKHGVTIELVNNHFAPVDKDILEFPYATERLTNIFPSKAGFKRINVTCIEKHPLAYTDISDDNNMYNRYQDEVPIFINEVDYSKVPKNEEVNLTCILINIKNDIGSVKNNTLDMFNMYSKSMNKLMTADEDKITIGNKLILPFREKAIIGGKYGEDEITQVECLIKIKNEHLDNIVNYFKSQDIDFYQTNCDKKYTNLTFIPDLIMNHTNRDNNIALRLLSNLRYESISENKRINISLKESNEKILKENDEIIVEVNILIGGKLITSLKTQLLFLTGYHQPTHSAIATAIYGKININYRQGLAAREVFTQKDFRWIIENFKKSMYKSKLICAGYEIIEVEDGDIIRQVRTADEMLLEDL